MRQSGQIMFGLVGPCRSLAFILNEIQSHQEVRSREGMGLMTGSLWLQH